MNNQCIVIFFTYGSLLIVCLVEFTFKTISVNFQKPCRLQPDRDEPDDVAGHDGEPGLLGPDRRDPEEDGGNRLVTFRQQTSQHA